MTDSSQPPPESSRSRFTIPFEVPAYWAPSRRSPYSELLDDPRELIWAHYDVRLIELIQAERAGLQTEIDPPTNANAADF